MSFYNSMSFKKDYKKLFNNGGIIKLKLDSSDRNKVKDEVKEHVDLECFEIKSDDDIYLIIRYRDIRNNIAYHDLMKKADRDFFGKRYRNSLTNYLELLECSICPTTELYAKIGLCYYNLKDLSKAGDYLMIANYKNNGNENFDLENSAKYFEERVKKRESEKYNTKSLEDKKEDFNKIKLNNIDEIMGYISMYDSDIETAGMEFDLSSEERDYIKLVLAEEFYKQGDIEKGNYYLNAVENSPNKSKKIIKFCEEVRKNKNFYQYREDNKPKKLTFIRTGKRR